MRLGAPILLSFLSASVACGGASSPAERASAPVDQETAGVAETASRPSRAEVLAELATPAPWSAETLDEWRNRVRSEADADVIPEEPSVGGPGALVIEESELPSIPHERTIDLLFRSEPPAGAEGRRVRSDPRLFRREPTARMDEEGRVEVSWETTRSSPAASVYWGTFVPEDVIPVARHRRSETGVEREANDQTHRARFDATRLLRPKYDVARIRERGRGTLAWRVEALDPARGTSRVFDGSLPFRCEPAPCAEGARFVQLPGFRLGPFVDLVRPDAAVVSWESDAATAGFVLVSPGEGEPRLFRSETVGTRHEVAIEGLAPATRYRYHAFQVDARGEVAESRGATFETAPGPEGRAFTFAVLSDSRSGHGAADARYAGTNREVLEALLLGAVEQDPSFVVFVGDLVDGYTTEPGSFRFELEAWQRATQAVGAYVPIYEAMGNHEVVLDLWETGWAIDRSGEESSEDIFAARFVNPENAPGPEEDAPPYRENVYSFDWGNAHVAVVNSNYWFRSHYHRDEHPAHPRGQREGWVDDRQLEWLDADLEGARARGAEHLFVMTHEPAFPNGGHVSDGMWWEGRFPEVNAQREKLLRILGEHGVAVLFHGDEHNYSRTRVTEEMVEGIGQPVWQVISGGAGAPFYAQNLDVPWAGSVVRFDARQHFVTVRVNGPRLELEAVSLTGETIERFRVR